jgi:acyl-CoA synthetase (AMP-forming)/AMP-acid ligase II
LGHGIVLVASPPPGAVPDTHALLTALRRRLPRYMVPLMVDWRETLPRNANGKFDRERLRQELAERFVDAGLDDSGGATTVDSGAD